MKKKYSKEEIAAARAQRREAIKVLSATRKILFRPMRRYRREDLYGSMTKVEKAMKKFEASIRKLEASVKKLAASKKK